MKQISEEQLYLLLGKITKTLDSEEEKQLQNLLNSNIDIQTAYDELLKELPASYNPILPEALKAGNNWKDITKIIKAHAATPVVSMPQPSALRKINKNLWVAVAAAVVVIGLSAVFIMSLIGGDNSNTNSNKIISPVALNTEGTGNNIRLQLANGKIIDLTDTLGTINTGNITLNLQQKSMQYSSDNTTTPAAINTLTVPIGRDYKIILADGTEVWLNSDTRLDFPSAFDNNDRKITIAGEAYLKVKKDVQRPFIVNLPSGTVAVTGTEFNVNSYKKGQSSVALVSGSVTVNNQQQSGKLTPGRQITFNKEQFISQSTFDERMVLSWKEGLFYFDNASLDEIVEVLPRWFGLTVSIDNKEIYQRKFSGVINRNSPISYFLDDLRVISKINSRVDAGGIVHFY